MRSPRFLNGGNASEMMLEPSEMRDNAQDSAPVLPEIAYPRFERRVQLVDGAASGAAWVRSRAACARGTGPRSRAGSGRRWRAELSAVRPHPCAARGGG